MSLRPAIRPLHEIEAIIYSADFHGGWKRRVNTKRKMIEWNNELISSEIDMLKSKIRKRKVSGEKNGDLRQAWAEITRLELQLIT